MRELTTSEKKVALACIKNGLEAEFRKGPEEVEAVLSNWKQGKFKDNNEAYYKMYATLDIRDKTIGRRYHNLTSSRYLITVAGLYVEGYITDEDIQGFSPGGIETILLWKQNWES